MLGIFSEKTEQGNTDKSLPINKFCDGDVKMSESEVTPSGDESATGTAAAEDATGIEVTGELELE